MDFKSKPVILVSIVVAVIVVAGGFWYWSKSKQAPPEEAPSLGEQIFDKTQNTLRGQVPDVNPFKDQKNPFDVIYKNPFE